MTVATLCLSIAPSYPLIDGDLLVTAALLHDVGRVEGLAYETSVGLHGRREAHRPRRPGRAARVPRRRAAGRRCPRRTVAAPVACDPRPPRGARGAERSPNRARSRRSSCAMLTISTLARPRSSKAVAGAAVLEERWTDGANGFARSLLVPGAGHDPRRASLWRSLAAPRGRAPRERRARGVQSITVQPRRSARACAADHATRRSPMALPTAEIGVFGGSGFYALLDRPEEHRVNTPFGAPSSPVMVGEIGGRTRRVPAAARQGPLAAAAHDQLPRERLGDEGARRHAHHRPERLRFAPAARPARRLRDLRSVRRPHVGAQGHVLRRAHHDARLVGRSVLPDDAAGRASTKAAELGITAHPTGTVVVIQGPRFSTRSESRWFASQGWEVINMTQYPECYLARELEICYCNISLITDHDAGAEGAEPSRTRRSSACSTRTTPRSRICSTP